MRSRLAQLWTVAALLFGLLPGAVQASAQPVPALADSALVATGHPEASRVGVAVLRAGGNAVDAAVAIGFALAVVLPDAGNVGGGGFLVLRQADGTGTSYDFRERAPLAASRDMFTRPVARSSTRGHLASGVPGTVAGLLAAHAAHGRLSRAAVLSPAIALAEGHTLTPRTAMLFNRHRADFSDFASTARLFTRAGGFRAGDWFEQPDLASVLRRIRDDGAAGFYAGETADLIVAEMQRGGGLISHADLAAYTPIEKPLLQFNYREHRILSMGPPSSGGIALAQVLRSVEPHPFGAMGFQSPAAVHLAGEALRRAFADRARWLGDPAYVEVPTDGLLDADYVARRMVTFDPARVSTSHEVGHGIPEQALAESSETTHYSVVDAEGNAVAVTTTLNDYFGSKVVVEGAGFFLNDEMDDFTTAPGRPNAWGLLQGEANAIAPGKRMVSSMTPVIVEDPQGRLFAVAGSPGGARIISTVFQVLTNLIDHGLDAQEAVRRPRFHHQWAPDVMDIEPGIAEATREGLRSRGWALRGIERFGAANIVVVRYDAAGRRTLEGGADPRREDDDARGY